MICVHYSSCRFDFADLGESLTMIRLSLAFAMVQPRTARRGVLKLFLGKEKEMSQGWRGWARRDELIRHSCFLFLNGSFGYVKVPSKTVVMLPSCDEQTNPDA